MVSWHDIIIVTIFISMTFSWQKAAPQLTCGAEKKLYNITNQDCIYGTVVQKSLNFVCGPKRVQYYPSIQECVDNQVKPKLTTTERPTGVTPPVEDDGENNGASHIDRAIYLVVLLPVLQAVFND